MEEGSGKLGVGRLKNQVVSLIVKKNFLLPTSHTLIIITKLTPNTFNQHYL
jgi:hypothetical protein